MANERTAEAAPKSKRNMILAALVAVIVIDVLAAFLMPPQPAAGTTSCEFPACGIAANLELPAPHVVWDLAPSASYDSNAMIQFHPSISSTILTSWIVMALILAVMILATRGMKQIPGRVQNVVELAYETLTNFATSLGGPAAATYVPLFAAFFLFILFSNWSGIVPPVGKVEFLRAPSSDVNITIGLALVAFVIFEAEGFRALGFRGYLSKFFPLGEFRNGIGAGVIALFVGLIELLLEFVKPLTLSMRLFGNIFGGEVALGVMTALTIAIIPVALVGLEFLLNAVQALIFSVLTLMFTLAAIEGHHEEEHPGGHDEEPIATPVPHPTLRRDPAH